MEIESYVEFFKKKRKFQISSIEGIKNILNSQKYNDFIEKLYKHYNSKVQLKENIRLSPKCYQETLRSRYKELLQNIELITYN